MLYTDHHIVTSFLKYKRKVVMLIIKRPHLQKRKSRVARLAGASIRATSFIRSLCLSLCMLQCHLEKRSSNSAWVLGQSLGESPLRWFLFAFQQASWGSLQACWGTTDGLNYHKDGCRDTNEGKIPCVCFRLYVHCKHSPSCWRKGISINRMICRNQRLRRQNLPQMLLASQP